MGRIGSWCKKHMKVCIAFQIIVLGILGVWCMGKEQTNVEAPLEMWESGLIEFNGDTWHISEQILESTGETAYMEMITGPHIKLPAGSYVVSISYSGEAVNYCKLVADHGKYSNAGLKADDIMLEPGETSKSFKIEATDDIDDFEIQIIYGGKGTLEINDIIICESRMRDMRWAYTCFCVFWYWTSFF